MDSIVVNRWLKVACGCPIALEVLVCFTAYEHYYGSLLTTEKSALLIFRYLASDKMDPDVNLCAVFSSQRMLFVQYTNETKQNKAKKAQTH